MHLHTKKSQNWGVYVNWGCQCMSCDPAWMWLSQKSHLPTALQNSPGERVTAQWQLATWLGLGVALEWYSPENLHSTVMPFPEQRKVLHRTEMSLTEQSNVIYRTVMSLIEQSEITYRRVTFKEQRKPAMALLLQRRLSVTGESISKTQKTKGSESEVESRRARK